MTLTAQQRDDLQSVSSSVEQNIWTRFIGQDCVMYDTMCYSTFFYVENLIQEIIDQRCD